jgi:hypothetical protein
MTDPHEVCEQKEPISCRRVARWLYSFAATVEGFAVSHALAGDERGAGNLEEHARGMQSIAQRLYEQKGVIRDGEMLVILLKATVPYVRASIRSPVAGEYYSQEELLAAIERHTQEGS